MINCDHNQIEISGIEFKVSYDNDIIREKAYLSLYDTKYQNLPQARIGITDFVVDIEEDIWVNISSRSLKSFQEISYSGIHVLKYLQEELSNYNLTNISELQIKSIENKFKDVEANERKRKVQERKAKEEQIILDEPTKMNDAEKLYPGIQNVEFDKYNPIDVMDYDEINNPRLLHIFETIYCLSGFDKSYRYSGELQYKYIYENYEDPSKILEVVLDENNKELKHIRMTNFGKPLNNVLERPKKCSYLILKPNDTKVEVSLTGRKSTLIADSSEVKTKIKGLIIVDKKFKILSENISFKLDGEDFSLESTFGNGYFSTDTKEKEYDTLDSAELSGLRKIANSSPEIVKRLQKEFFPNK